MVDMNRDFLTRNERFWSKVDVRGDDECWEWTAFKHKGYGSFRVGPFGKSPANRVAWELYHRQKLGSRLACHTCDNRGCCNPLHIYAGTPKQNANDAKVRGRLAHRGAPGERNGFAKLTWEQVETIRKRLADGERPMRISIDYDVSEGAVIHIRDGRTWNEQRTNKA